MKLNKLFAAFMLIAATVFVGCEPQNPPGPGGPGNNGQGNDKDTTQTVDPIAPDTIGWNIPTEAITASEARALCEALPADQTTGTKYYVMGYIKKLHSANADGIAKFGNASFYMEDVKGANSKDDFVAFQVMGLDGKKITDPAAVAEGDFVVVYGELVNFKGNTPETVGKGAAYIWKSTNPLLTDNGSGNQGGNQGNENPTDVVGDGSLENPFTANDVLLLANNKTGNFYVKAYIVGQVNGTKMSDAEWNTPFSSSTNQSTGQLTGYNTNLLIANSADETNTDNCVPVQLPSGALRTGLNLVQHPEMDGQEILIYGSLEKYFGVAGIKSPTYAKVGDKEFGTNPNGGNSGNTSDGTELLNETLMTQASFDKFTAVSVSGEQAWTFDAKYGAKMSGFADNTTHPNEDWFITPALNLAGKSNVKLTFNHAFGPAAQVPNTDAKKAQYTIWVSNDFNGDVKTATWTELKGMVYGDTGWGYVSSGDIVIPAENLKANCRIAWKYVCEDVSATWEIKEVIVK